MKCSSCSVVVSSEFAFALKLNQCPRCGKQILPPEQLASYTSLKNLVDKAFPSVDSEKLANLIVANFELKQLFKEDVFEVYEDNAETKQVAKSTQATKPESKPLSDKDMDDLHKMKQMADAKEQLKKLREEAYNDALKSQFGMGDEEGGIDLNPDLDLGGEVSVSEIAQGVKYEKSRSQMLSGAGGFKRSDG